MKLAAKIELSFIEFWEMTPYEFNLKVKAYYEKEKKEFKDRLSLEYYNAMWTIQWLGKKSQQPQPLKELLDGLEQEKKEMSDDEMLKTVKVLNKLLGGEEV